jgi:hypothetical protein
MMVPRELPWIRLSILHKLQGGTMTYVSTRMTD